MSQISGPLRPEYGGNGNYLHDLGVVAGTTQPAQPEDRLPPGSVIGGNGVIGMPNNSSGGASIDIPANGSKPHETLHY